MEPVFLAAWFCSASNARSRGVYWSIFAPALIPVDTAGQNVVPRGAQDENRPKPAAGSDYWATLREDFGNLSN